MPLRADLSDGPHERNWPGFVQTWACHTLEHLNLRVLSERYTAHLDVNKYKFAFDTRYPEYADPEPVVVGVTDPFPPPPALSATGDFAEPQTIDVVVRDEELHHDVAAVVYAQPAFIETPLGRRTFAMKCLRHLQRGQSVVAVNAVAEQPTDLHAELVDLYGRPELRLPRPLTLGAAGYRVRHTVIRADEEFRLEVWPYPVAVGDPLPTVPLWLAADLAVPLDLDATYAAACRSLRLG